MARLSSPSSRFPNYFLLTTFTTPHDHLVSTLVTGNGNLLCVDDNDVVAGVNVWRIYRLVLTTQTTGNLGRQATQRFVCGINHIPVALDFMWLGAERFHLYLCSVRGLQNKARNNKEILAKIQALIAWARLRAKKSATIREGVALNYHQRRMEESSEGQLGCQSEYAYFLIYLCVCQHFCYRKVKTHQMGASDLQALDGISRYQVLINDLVDIGKFKGRAQPSGQPVDTGALVRLRGLGQGIERTLQSCNGEAD